MCVPTELAVFGQAECVQISFDVQNDGEFGAASDFNDWRTAIIDSGWLLDNLCGIVANATLTALVVTASVHNTGVSEE